MNVSSVSTKTSRHETNLKEVFHDLVKSRSYFNVNIELADGTEFPVPFANGVAANAKVERAVKEVLAQTFGKVEYS